MPNKYARIPQATLDLHQYTKQEADQAVLSFLQESEEAHHTLVRIIVGKGIHSKEGPVLGEYVRNLLHEHEYVFRDAKVTEGGGGAVDVHL